MFYFVSTPIGNLKDISFRAIETLENADVIACEDTRTSLKLLNHYNIKKQLVAYHKFNEIKEAERLIEEHSKGKNIAVITDAGTPVISDPGNALTKILRERNIDFTVVPGANAFVPALILSGFDASRFCFVGFLPEKKTAARKLLENYADLDATLLFYSAPHDLKKNISLLSEILGNRRAAAVKEITKLHERTEIFCLADGILEEEPKGEYVVVVEGAKQTEKDFSDLSVKDHLDLYLKEGMTKMDAIKKVAKDRGVKKSEIYDLVKNNE
ncbi:MAG: 16S rRNA (cytidine(1402)-2'-O)-methyltransferase [Clostridia bacterium]|nr:16S rRNA (cytidine(1402)-2'-O)-methyltransferase [Clostridia bacterium]